MKSHTGRLNSCMLVMAHSEHFLHISTWRLNCENISAINSSVSGSPHCSNFHTGAGWVHVKLVGKLRAMVSHYTGKKKNRRNTLYSSHSAVIWLIMSVSLHPADFLRKRSSSSAGSPAWGQLQMDGDPQSLRLYVQIISPLIASTLQDIYTPTLFLLRFSLQ